VGDGSQQPPLQQPDSRPAAIRPYLSFTKLTTVSGFPGTFAAFSGEGGFIVCFVIFLSILAAMRLFQEVVKGAGAAPIGSLPYRSKKLLESRHRFACSSGGEKSQNTRGKRLLLPLDLGSGKPACIRELDQGRSSISRI
jgi:hypothetical protein